MFGKKKNETAGTQQTSGKKRKGWLKWVILAAVVGIIVFMGYRSMNANKSKIAAVDVMTIERGDIEEIVSISGTVGSALTKDYYAGYSARVAAMSLKDGDRVKKGDMLISFDSEELEYQKKQAELSLQQADGSYDDSISREQKGLSKKYTADKNLPVVQAQIDGIQAQIDALNEQIKQKQHRMAEVGLQLQQTMYDVNQNGIADGASDPFYQDAQDEDGNEIYLQLQRSVAQNSFAQTNDEEIMGWNKQINDLNEQLSKLNEKKSELKSDQASGENAGLTEGGKSSLEAQREISRLTNEKTLKDIEKAEAGVKADFSGVVTEIAVDSGATPMQGSKLLRLSSTEDVKITMQISKSDLSKIKKGQAVDITVSGRPYRGEVSWISGSAVRNSSNVPVVDGEVKVLDPDENIVLGVEASMKIHTSMGNNVLILPYEYVGTDVHGDFVYIVEDGKLIRRDVKTGITTGTDAEIAEGLTDGDQIVTSDIGDMQEGTAVVVNAQTTGE